MLTKTLDGSIDTNSKHSFLYLDSNVYSRLCESKADFEATTAYIAHSRLTVMVSAAVLTEKHKADRQHATIAKFWKQVGAVLVEPYTKILEKALDRYPAPHLVLPEVWLWFAQETEAEIVAKLLAGPAIARMDDSLRRNAAEVADRFRQTKSNFPPDSAAGTYTERQTRAFAETWTVQELESAFPTHPKLRSLRLPLVDQSFLPSRMHSSLVFWKYLYGQREPKKLSDLGDRAHAPFFPYCAEIVVEKDQANIVRQLRRKFPELFIAAGQTLTMTEFFAKIRA